jgi:hypothetical protein
MFIAVPPMFGVTFVFKRRQVVVLAVLRSRMGANPMKRDRVVQYRSQKNHFLSFRRSSRPRRQRRVVPEGGGKVRVRARRRDESLTEEDVTLAVSPPDETPRGQQQIVLQLQDLAVLRDRVQGVVVQLVALLREREGPPDVDRPHDGILRRVEFHELLVSLVEVGLDGVHDSALLGLAVPQSVRGPDGEAQPHLPLRQHGVVPPVIPVDVEGADERPRRLVLQPAHLPASVLAVDVLRPGKVDVAAP